MGGTASRDWPAPLTFARQVHVDRVLGCGRRLTSASSVTSSPSPGRLKEDISRRTRATRTDVQSWGTGIRSTILIFSRQSKRILKLRCWPPRRLRRNDAGQGRNSARGIYVFPEGTLSVARRDVSLRRSEPKWSV